jgi:hypothetical protein
MTPPNDKDTAKNDYIIAADNRRFAQWLGLVNFWTVGF